MKNTMRTFATTSALALVMGFAASGSAMAIDNSASVEIQNQTISVTSLAGPENQLNFGVVLPFGRAGYVTVNAGGTLGTVHNAHVSNSLNVASAGFSVAGVNNAYYGINLPATATLVSDLDPTDTLVVNTFTHTGGAYPRLDGDGNDSFRVGARLHISPNQPAGNYTGTYPITVAYN